MNTSNPSLYDQSCPRFILINNILNQKILDGDIVDLNNFNDYLVLPDEPEGFDGAELLLQRDEQYHGFNYEYQVDSLKFACDFGKGYLDSIFEQQGTDANVLFIYGYGTLDNVNVLYVGGLDFNEYSVEDSEYTILNIRKDDFGNILQSNFDIPQEVEPDKDLILYSKAIPKRVVYKIAQNNTSVALGQFSTKAFMSPAYGGRIQKSSPKGFLFINDEREGDRDLEIFVSYDFQVEPRNPVDADVPKFLFRAKQSSNYALKVSFSVGLQVIGTPVDYDFCYIEYVKTESNGATIIKKVSNIKADIVEDNNTSSSATKILVFDKTIEEVVDVEQCLYFYIVIDTAHPSFTSNMSIRDIFSEPFKGSIDNPSLTVIAETLAPLSFTKVRKAYDVINDIFKTSSKLTYPVVKSNFLNNGCGSKLNITNGFWIRGGDKTISLEPSKLKIKDSASGFVNKIASLFNLGWGVEYDEQGRDIVRVEPAEYFYQNSEILSIDSNKITDYNLQVDSSQIYNEIEVGFNKYSKQRETEKGNTIDDFHTKHTYQTPILKNKAKKTIATDLVLSAYEIEILRRKQFDVSGDSTSANYNNDEDLFGVQILSDTPFTGGTYTGIITDVTTGDIIFLGKDTLILVDRQYYFEGQLLGVKVDNSFANTSVKSIQIGRFTPVGYNFPILGTKIVFNNPIPDPAFFGVNPTVEITSTASINTGDEMLVEAINQLFFSECRDFNDNQVSCSSFDVDYSITNGTGSIIVQSQAGVEIDNFNIVTQILPVTVTYTTVSSSNSLVFDFDFQGYLSNTPFYMVIEVETKINNELYEKLRFELFFSLEEGNNEPTIGITITSREFYLDIEPEQLEGYLIPESTEPFVSNSIQNLISPLTTYNLRYTPKRMLLQHAKMFMGAFRAKEDDNFIEFKQGDGNTTLTTKFNAGETCVLGDIDKLMLVEGGNLELNEIFNNKYLFLPYKVTFDYPLSFEELNYIRNCMRGTSPDNNNYGYITYTNPKGNVERIFLTEIKYNPAMEEATITGLIKGNYNYIS